MTDPSCPSPEELLGINTNPTSDDTDDEDDSPPNYIMVCHECGDKRDTRDRACKTTRKAKTGDITWSDCRHQIYFTRDAIKGLREVDIIEAAKHFDGGLAHVEGNVFPRFIAHFDYKYDDYQDVHRLIGTPHFWDTDEHDYVIDDGTLEIAYWQSNDADEWNVDVTVGGMREDYNDALDEEETEVELLELSEV